MAQLAAETGIPRDTLYGWRREALGQARRSPTAPAPAGTLGSDEKFAVVMETATLYELELGAYCRNKGLFAEQISAWRETCVQANAPRFANLSPHQIVPALADEGCPFAIRLASESTFYRLLRDADQLARRTRAKAPARWSGSTRDWTPPASVLLNPGKPPRGKVNSDTETT